MRFTRPGPATIHCGAGRIATRIAAALATSDSKIVGHACLQSVHSVSGWHRRVRALRASFAAWCGADRGFVRPRPPGLCAFAKPRPIAAALPCREVVRTRGLSTPRSRRFPRPIFRRQRRRPRHLGQVRRRSDGHGWRQMLRHNSSTASHNQRVIDGVPQLANIAPPRPLLQLEVPA